MRRRFAGRYDGGLHLQREKGVDPSCGARRHERGDDRNQGKNRRRAANHERIVPLETEDRLIQRRSKLATPIERR